MQEVKINPKENHRMDEYNFAVIDMFASSSFPPTQFDKIERKPALYKKYNKRKKRRKAKKEKA